MFNNLFQSLKEIGNPKVQDGQVIQNPELVGTEKPVVLDEDGEITEEGFVSIGRSSFYSLNNEVSGPTARGPSLYPSISSSSSNPFTNMPLPQPHGGPTSPYPYSPNYNPTHVPYPPHHHAPLHSVPSLEISDMVRGLPLVLHPDLRPHVGLYDTQLVNRMYNNRRSLDLDLTEFQYDFNFERGVLRDINRQFN